MQVSSKDETVFLGTTIIKKRSDFSVTPEVGKLVGYTSEGKIENKTSLISSNNHNAIGMVIKINGSTLASTVIIGINGFFYTNVFDSFSANTELFLGVNGNVLSSIETNTNYIKKIADKIDNGILLNIKQTEEYVNL